MNLSRVIRHINTRPVGERNLLVPDDEQPRQRSYSLKVPYAAPHKLQSERRWTRKWSTVRRKKEDKVEEVKLPLKKSMFGATLEEVMDLQKDSHPTHHLPWVLTLLADKIIEFNGLEMEGIFRVPGDIDEVNALKVALDSGDHVKNFGTQDPSVCASLLKEWLRDLYDPIIPESLYNQCIEYCDHAQWTPNVIKDLPDIHRLVVTYIIRFLQKFAEKENVPKTKMTTDNLAMVFAPNLLRCPSDDPQIIYENTLKQMTFVKTLIVNLDTAYMDSVV